jgi:glycosyltransferase involved in cell wall biosynthesis
VIRVLALSLYGPQAASHRVRLSQFQPGLAAVGIDMKIQSLLGNDYLQTMFAGNRPSSRVLLKSIGKRLAQLTSASSYDVAILYAELIPLLPAWAEHLLLKIPYIYDFDDAFYLKYRTGRLARLAPLLGKKIDRLLASASAVTAGNEHLADYASRFNSNVVVLPSVVDTSHFKPLVACSWLRASPRFTVGWIGSPSTAPYLGILVEPLQALARERPVRFLVVGANAPVIPGVEVIEVPWSDQSEVELIQSFDVGVMPLPDTDWCRGKCAYKLIQCMACSIPVIASPVGTNFQAVPPSCGILAENPGDWLGALSNIADSAGLRRAMGEAGREWVQKRYSLDVALPVLSELIHGLASRGS